MSLNISYQRNFQDLDNYNNIAERDFKLNSLQISYKYIKESCRLTNNLILLIKIELKHILLDHGRKFNCIYFDSLFVFFCVFELHLKTLIPYLIHSILILIIII